MRFGTTERIELDGMCQLTVNDFEKKKNIHAQEFLSDKIFLYRVAACHIFCKTPVWFPLKNASKISCNRRRFGTIIAEKSERVRFFRALQKCVK